MDGHQKGALSRGAFFQCMPFMATGQLSPTDRVCQVSLLHPGCSGATDSLSDTNDEFHTKQFFSSSIGCGHREDRHYRRIAAPAQAINSFGRWTYTLHGACATTFAATLPRKNRLSLVILRWPIMIMDTSSFSAKLMISS